MANWAIAVGINNYNPNNFAPLRYAKRDAELMRDFFLEAGFDRVYFFSDNSPDMHLENGAVVPTHPSCGNLRSFLLDRFESSFLLPGDNFWFFFAGHGMQYANCDYLMPIDANPRDPQIAIPVSFVSQRLSRSGADNVILMLDACRSEGSRDSVGIGNEVQQGIITISSCGPTEKSWEIEALQQGVFTYALLEALRLSGEQNCATVERLSRYLRHRVPELCRQHGKVPNQTPRISVDPAEKIHLILQTRFATLADIATLKTDAYRLAFIENKPELAEQICYRAIVASMGTDWELLNLFTAIHNRLPLSRNSQLNEFASSLEEVRSAGIQGVSDLLPLEPDALQVSPLMESEISVVDGSEDLPIFDTQIDLTESSNEELHSSLELLLGEPSSLIEESSLLSETGLPTTALADSESLIANTQLETQAQVEEELNNAASPVDSSRSSVLPNSSQSAEEAISSEESSTLSEPQISNPKTKKFNTWIRSLNAQRLKQIAGIVSLVAIAGLLIYRMIPPPDNTTQPSTDLGTSPSPTQTPNISQDLKSKIPQELKSLESLLKSRDWKAADQKTFDIMTIATDNYRQAQEGEGPKYGFLDYKTLGEFDCQLLQEIENLWVAYSDGKFGFITQRNLLGAKKDTTYPQIQNQWESFIRQVGWYSTQGPNSGWISYDEIASNSPIPRGHLPARWFFQSTGTRQTITWRFDAALALYKQTLDCPLEQPSLPAGREGVGALPLQSGKIPAIIMPSIYKAFQSKLP